MAITLTKDMLAHAYDLLASTPVMAKMNLPPSEDVKFRIYRSKAKFGEHSVIGGVHHVAISAGLVGSFMTLIMTMAHEQIHIYQDIAGLPRDDGKGFQKIADKVCKALEFDRLIF